MFSAEQDETEYPEQTYAVLQKHLEEQCQ